MRLPLSQSKVNLGTVDKRDVAERIITSQKPAFTSYTLEIDVEKKRLRLCFVSLSFLQSLSHMSILFYDMMRRGELKARNL